MTFARGLSGVVSGIAVFSVLAGVSLGGTATVHAKDSGPIPAVPAPASFADLADRLLPAVVNISSTQKIENVEEFPEFPQFPPGSPFEDFFDEFMDRQGSGQPAVPPASLGSGFIVDAGNGYIVTNNHVVKDAEEVRVTFFDDETIEAEIIGRDEKTDLAVLKVETDKKLTAVAFGDSDVLRVGDWVLAIGNPFGLGGTVTAGIVSAQQRDIHAGPYDDFIQTDASINRGNSGGPMFDLEGKVIGINTAIFSPSGGSVGIGFAIPSSLAKPVIDQIVKYGRTRRGWLGVRIQSVTEEISESLGLGEARGALVASVTPEGPAAAAGMKTGDVILSFDGKEVSQMRTLPRIVAETPIDEEIEVKLWRDGKTLSVFVKIGELEKAEEDGLFEVTSHDGNGPSGQLDFDELGLGLSALGEAERKEYHIPRSTEGVLISEVKNLSQAAEKGLLPGDIIVEVDQGPVSTPSDVKDKIEAARKKGRKSVLFLLSREGDVRFVALKIKRE